MQLTNNLTYVKGNHTYTLGFSYEKFEFDNSFNLGVYGYGDDRGYAGAFGAFGSLSDFTTAINNGLIRDAIAAATTTYENDSWSLAETNVGQMSFYLQDEWFVNDKFKLTYGLRMDKPLYFDSDKKAQEVIDGTGDYLSLIHI